MELQEGFEIGTSGSAAVASRAIEYLRHPMELPTHEYRSMYSCNAIYEAENTLYLSELRCIEIMKEYHKFSRAKLSFAGFYGVGDPLQKYFNRDKENVETQNYRLEMLYYFWMANQEM